MRFLRWYCRSLTALNSNQRIPSPRSQKFKANYFFGERVVFTNFNPYDNARLRRKRFRTASQANFYSSILFDKDKVFDHEHIPHVDMESMPCFTPVLSMLHNAGLLNFCTHIVDWNEELILQFYAMLLSLVKQMTSTLGCWTG